VKRANRQQLPSHRERHDHTLLRQIRREAGLDRLRRDNARLKIQFSRAEWIQLAVLILFMLLAMALGAYLVRKFKGVIIDV